LIPRKILPRYSALLRQHIVRICLQLAENFVKYTVPASTAHLWLTTVAVKLEAQFATLNKHQMLLKLTQ